jgi:Cof subfamily protein (haloacid dehalogenase superfamily)
MIDLVCIDVDGTLIGTSGSVAPAVWEAAARARAAGLRLAMCSGRPAFGISRRWAECLDPEGWHVFQNGASVVHLPTGASRSRPLDASIVEELIARSRRASRILELYTDGDYAVERDDDRARRHASVLGLPFQPRSFDSLRGPLVRAQWLVAREAEAAVLAEPHAGLTVSPSLSPVMSDTVFVNLTPAGIDKGSAVRAVAREYGTPLERVMVVGDGANDAAAMRIVGWPVAMGNAEPEVRAVARHVVAHVDEEGLVEALELATEGARRAALGAGRGVRS